MSNFFGRQGAADRNDLSRSLATLVGIAQGLLCDGELTDEEIYFLNDWLTQNTTVSSIWPGDLLLSRVRDILADGYISPDERDYLKATLQQLIGGTLEQLADNCHVTELAIDQSAAVSIPGATFCLTGDFVFASRAHCEAIIERQGGSVKSAVSKKVNYVVVGGLGSPEWKHGSFGTKIEKAMEYKRQGAPILIVHEDQWAAALA